MDNSDGPLSPLTPAFGGSGGGGAKKDSDSPSSSLEPLLAHLAKASDLMGAQVASSLSIATAPSAVATSTECEEPADHGGDAGCCASPKPRASKGNWTEEEDKTLTAAVVANGGKNWKKISEGLSGRTDVQCLHRWQKVLKPGIVKGPWTEEEDRTLGALVMVHGCKKWSHIASQLTGRLGKQCRERWFNHLDPAITKEAWTRVIHHAQHQPFINYCVFHTNNAHVSHCGK